MKTALRLAFENVPLNRKTNGKLAKRVFERMLAQDERIAKARAARKKARGE